MRTHTSLARVRAKGNLTLISKKSQKNTVEAENNFSLEKSRNIHYCLYVPASSLANQSYDSEVIGPAMHSQ